VKTFSLCLFFFLALYHHPCFSQGCSDAGFCSIDGIKSKSAYQNSPIPGDSIPLANALKTGISVGNTRYNVWILNSYTSYTRQINHTTRVSLKLDGQVRFGELSNVSGFSDLTLSLSHQLSNSFGLITGGKIPLTDANRTSNGRSMPMAYQTGLGTYDIFLGMQYSHEKLFFAAGYQQPLVHNSNFFRPENFTVAELDPSYPETYQFTRAGDILLRISYHHKPQTSFKKFSFSYSLLPIFHVGNDKYTDVENNVREIADSKGLTLNTNVFAYYAFDQKTGLEISTGVPVLARKARPEGLSQFALTFEFIRRF